MGLAKTLTAEVRAWLDEQYPYWTIDRSVLPEGLRLEMHPGVYSRILRDPDTWRWRPNGEGLADAFGLPVKVTADVGRDTWRLAVVTEDVKLAGKVAA